MIVETSSPPTNKVRRQEESRLQAECYKWCWNTHPETRRLLFHVENERTGSNKIDGARRKAMGLVPGVSDLILLIPRHPYHGMMIEMKTPEGRQSEEQRTWQALVEAQGYRYEVCRSLEQFQIIIEEYLKNK